MEFAAAAVAVAAYSQDGVRAAFHELRRDTRGTELEVHNCRSAVPRRRAYLFLRDLRWVGTKRRRLDPAAALAPTRTRFSVHLCTRACRIVPLSSLHAAWLAPNQI